MAIAYRYAGIVLLGTCFSLAGCSTPPPQVFDESLTLRAGSKVEIGEITTRVGRTLQVDAAAWFRFALENAARERGILYSSDSSDSIGDRYILNLDIVEYEPGNSFTRWIVGVWGSATLGVRGQLLDTRNGVVAGRIAHERIVYQSALHEVGEWKPIFNGMADEIMEDLKRRASGLPQSRRSEPAGLVVPLVPWSAQDPELPRAASSRVFSIPELTDARPNPGEIGTRALMGNVYASRDVAGYMHEVISDDLRGQGHRLVEGGSADVLSAQIKRFWLRADATPLYFDITAEIEMIVSVASETPSFVVEETPISCETKDRTYVWPSGDLMGRVLQECIVELIESLRPVIAVDAQLGRAMMGSFIGESACAIGLGWSCGWPSLRLRSVSRAGGGCAAMTPMCPWPPRAIRRPCGFPAPSFGLPNDRGGRIASSRSVRRVSMVTTSRARRPLSRVSPHDSRRQIRARGLRPLNGPPTVISSFA